MGIVKTAAAALLLACTGTAAAWSGNVNGTIGARMLDDDWAPVDEQPAFGVLADFQLADLPLYAVVGLQISVDEDDYGSTDFVASIADFSAGLKLMPASGTFRPYVNAGFVSVGASAEIDDNPGDDEDDDQDFGYFFGGGAIFRIGSHFNIGADLRWIRGVDLQLFGSRFDGDSFVATALFGYGWGD